jgi:hypothetical protein
MNLRTCAVLLCAQPISACTATHDFRHPDFITKPTPAQYSVCHSYTCAAVSSVKLQPAQWGSVRALFEPPPVNAAQERERIVAAVALLETYTGEQAGTAHDQAGNWDGLGKPGQMDCVDESINTSTSLRMMEADGLLRWHEVAPRATRGLDILAWPHSTAVIRERASNANFAVDSWFHDNGVAPEILPLAEWRSGWEPANFR